MVSTRRPHNCVKNATLQEQCTKNCQALLKRTKAILKMTMLFRRKVRHHFSPLSRVTKYTVLHQTDELKVEKMLQDLLSLEGTTPNP